MGRLGDTRAVEPLIQRLSDLEPIVREAACEALGRLADVRAVEPLIQRVGDKNWYVGQAASQALGKLGDVRAVGVLMERLRDHYPAVYYTASRALASIGKALDAHQLFCSSCLARFQRKGLRFERVGTVSIPVCRLCERAADAILDVREVVAVLDAETRQELSCADGVARVSYLKRNAPFDFDRVEIVRASDYEVERFCVQVGNDTDPFRRERYRQMRCLVAPGCRLSENTLRILGSMFGQVESLA